MNEAQTRHQLIDVALAKAGWDVNAHDQVGLEIPVDGFDPAAWEQLRDTLQRQDAPPETQLPSGISDYALYRSNGEILAVVEAKRASFDPRNAEAQLTFYLNEIEKRQSFRPFGFTSNGYQLYFFEPGAVKRQVYGFFSQDDLERLLYLRQHREPLSAQTPDPNIAGRPYQIEAIRRVSEAFEDGKRKALVVMATGTGKTRTVMSLIDVLSDANWVRNVLFVADRDALVNQALNKGFKTFLPDEPCVRLTSANAQDQSKRLYAVTLQTLGNIYTEFTPGYFDLIVFDESHRSIFNKYNAPLSYFDARMIGLTATPASFIDRNTFLAFECDIIDGQPIPTYLYSYQRAVDERYLVDYGQPYQAKTGFQRDGLKGQELSDEEKQALWEQGHDPDDIDFDSDDFEKTVSNTDTLRQQWREVMEYGLKDESGQRLGKTIVFASGQGHAQRLQEVFETSYPQLPGFSTVITNKSEYKGTLLEAFTKKDLPRIAISVDMLDTGVDVPEVVNLVFMRPVSSRIKLEQMLGRGTRNHDACEYYDRLPNGHKDRFLVMDFWQNDFKREAGEPPPAQKPLLVMVFLARLRLLEHLRKETDSPVLQRAVDELRDMVAMIPTDHFEVRPHLYELEPAFDDDFWLYITPKNIKFLRTTVAPLLRHANIEDVDAWKFIRRVESLKADLLEFERLEQGDIPEEVDDPALRQRELTRDINRNANNTAEDVNRMPSFVRNDEARRELVAYSRVPHNLRAATCERLSEVIDAFAEEMKNKVKDPPSAPIILDLEDPIVERNYAPNAHTDTPAYVSAYYQEVEAEVMALLEHDPVIAALQSGEPVSDLELIQLERNLEQQLGGALSTLQQTGTQATSWLALLREMLELPDLPDYASVVRERFQDFVTSHPFDADQTLFLNRLAEVMALRRTFRPAQLYDAPFSVEFGHNALERYFEEGEIKDMVTLINNLSVGT